ncbi:LOW QUALITY PROTEIN: eukaryotic translation initiation factor 1b-like [Sarcophilus harrisii]
MINKRRKAGRRLLYGVSFASCPRCVSSFIYLPSSPPQPPDTGISRVRPVGVLSPHRPLTNVALHCPELQSSDPFADATKGDDLLLGGTEDYVHIRIQQRNGKKTLTTVQRVADDYDKMKLVKFACNDTAIERPEYGVMQLQGDQRKNICQFLLEVGVLKESPLKVQGF